MKRAVLGVVAAGLFMVLITSVPAKAGLSSAEKGKIGVEAILWWPQMSGNVTFDTKYISGTELDLQDTLNLDDVTTTFELGAWFNLTKRNRFSFYWFMDQRDGSRVLEERVKIAGKKFAAGGKIDSELDVQRYKLMYERALIRRDQGRIALGVGFSFIDANAKIKGILMGGENKSVEDRIQFPLPVIGAAAELHLPLGFGVFAEGCGLGMTYSDVSGNYFDARGGVNWKSRFVFAQAGYQYFLLSAKAADAIKVDYSLVGPFLSVGAKF